MVLEVERRLFAGAQKVRDIFHLDEWHGRLLEFNAWWWYREVNQSKVSGSVLVVMRDVN